MRNRIIPEFETQNNGWANYITKIEHPFLDELLVRIYKEGGLVIKEKSFVFVHEHGAVYFTCFDGHVYLELIRTNKVSRRQGHATRVMQMLVEIANQTNTPIALKAGGANKSKGALPERQLPAFYKKFGFVMDKTKDFSNMLYMPKVLA